MINKINSFAEYNTAYQKSTDNPEAFWAEIANTFSWRSKWDKVLDWEFNTPDVNWFVNGKLNITENCLDRHLEQKGNDVAIIWNLMILMKNPFLSLITNYIKRYVHLLMS